MPNSEEEKTAEKRDKRLSAVFSHYFLIFSSCAFSQLKSKDLRTEHSLERFPDVFDRDRLQAVLLLHIIAHVRRDDAAPESQPCDLRQALIQMAHGADLAGQADLTDGSIGILDLMLKCKLAPSKKEARRLVEQGGVTVNDEKVSAIETTFGGEQFTGDGVIIKKGKKVFHRAVLV